MNLSKAHQVRKVNLLKPKKVRLIPLPKLMKKADDVFAAWIRQRDGRCYALDIPGEAQRCKGHLNCCHLIGRGKKAIRFDEKNCNGGCSFHNQIHDHTMRPQPHIYTGWFIRKYGADAYLDLEARAKVTKKWTREELNGIIEKYKALNKEEK